jgi:hypothetical protein
VELVARDTTTGTLGSSFLGRERTSISCDHMHRHTPSNLRPPPWVVTNKSWHKQKGINQGDEKTKVAKKGLKKQNFTKWIPIKPMECSLI